MPDRPLRILSNFKGLAAELPPELPVEHIEIPQNAGALAAFRIFRQAFGVDAILLDGNPPYLALLCLLRRLWPFQRAKLVSADIMFVKPVTAKQRLRARAWRWVLRPVDHFIHYFKDLAAYDHHFAVGPDRSTFVPFKVNGWDLVPPADQLSADGKYVFTGGRSLRDLDTFLAAMARVPYPGILLYHDQSLLRENGTTLDLNQLPPNVRAVEDDGSARSWNDHMRGAKLVVLTTLPDSIRAIGVSSYLKAMALQKCVIITDGPTVRGIVEDKAIIVPPSDPAALAAAIDRAWTDDALREQLATRGRAYAARLGDAARLFADLVRVCYRLCGRPVDTPDIIEDLRELPQPAGAAR